ncbi:MAG: UDP-N-acetyl glucosamine 2-epimerase [Prevotella sp.]|nr:UDP-N-acetyl glucosamine 2-epimerase [Prevotella sp.]MDY6130270.1 UDP-N-acetyl glucosamine 2-epimerase [Prevotella sp.]
MTYHVCIVAGARPNFIKVAPLIRAIRNAEGIDYKLVYTGKEGDTTIEGTLFDDLQIPMPDVYLGVACGSLNELTGKVMGEFEHYLEQYPTDTVVVVDDLASTMAAAIVTKKRGVRLAHLVAGTRSFDISMPKEVNRLVIDGLSDLLFTAGISNNSITNREGAEQSRVYMVGNILIDNLRFNHSRWQRPRLMADWQLADGGYIVFTLNRKALVSETENLQRMLEAMTAAAAGMPIVAPLRGDARRAVEEIVRTRMSECPHLASIRLVDSLSYLEFGYLTANAKGIVTDSGNVAEEATFNAVPCITLNSYTEHIETVKAGSNVLVGEDADKLRAAVDEMVNGKWKKCSLPERWDGRTAERIVRILVEKSL